MKYSNNNEFELLARFLQPWRHLLPYGALHHSNGVRGMFLLLFLCLLFQPINASRTQNQWEASYLHLDQETGLGGQVVYDIYRDKLGFVWIGTDMGLSRYDGYGFVNYSPGDGLTDSDIFGIREDSKGRLWFMTGNGIPCYYANGEFHNPLNDAVLKQIEASGFMSAFYEDKSHNIYLGFWDGKAYKIGNNGKVTLLPCESVCRILGFSESEDLGLFMAYHVNWVKSLEKPGRPRRMISEFVVHGSDNYPVKFLRLGNGNSIYTWGKNVRVLDRNLNGKVHLNIIPEGKIIGIFKGIGSSIYLGTTSGAYHFLDEGFEQEIDSVVLPNQPVYSILEDETTGTWFGTDEGIFLRPRDKCLKMSNVKDIGRPTTMAMAPNRHLYLGFANGKIFEFDSSLDLVRSDSIGNLEVKSFHPRNEGETWIRSSGGIFRWTLNGVEKIQKFNTRSLDFSESKPDELAICNNNGWFLLDATSYTEVLFGDKRILFPEVNNPSQCYCLKYDTEGTLWISASDGIFRKIGEKLERFRAIESLTNYSTIEQILPSIKGPVYFATVGNGLVAFYKGTVVRITTANGLESNFVTALAEDLNGRLWVGTTKGVQLINMQNDDGRLIDNSEGISMWLKNESVKAVAAGDEYVFVATTNDIFAITKESNRSANSISDPMIERILLPSGAVPIDTSFVLGYAENSIAIDFISISILAAKTIQYRFRLLGLTDEWTETVLRTASFQSLNPGAYRFELQARQFGSEWNSRKVTVVFQILPPFWQTIWFITLCILASASLLIVILWIVWRDINRRNELVNRTLIAEQKALITQMNPHFIFNSLNSIQYFYITNELETANEYLADFGLLIRAILENGRKQRISLDEEVEVLTLYSKLERLRLRFKFEYKISVQGLEPAKILIPPMILQPFVENSIWHGLSKKPGNDGFLEIRFSIERNCLLVTISDNGIGRKKSAEYNSDNNGKHTSLATAITRERMDILKQSYPDQVSFQIEDIINDQGNGSGTIVRIMLPLEYVTS